MAIDQEKITRAWALLAPALGHDLRTIISEVAQGVAQLIEWGDGEFYTVIRTEMAATGKELVIVAAAGKNSLTYLVKIHEQAKAQGFSTVRLHTLKPAPMLRMSDRANLGYKPAETILRAVL